jgi:pyrroloquinoline quinone (PQQ) biosynthesis protein C
MDSPMIFPELRHGLIWTPGDDGIAVRRHEQRFLLDPELGSIADLALIPSLLDGTRSIATIAQVTGVSPDDISELVRTLDEHDLLVSLPRHAAVSTHEFLAQLDLTVAAWRASLADHPLYAALHIGSAPPEILHGLLIETYHYVVAATQHIAAAIQGAAAGRNRRLLDDYYLEEREHYPLVLATLERLGIEATLVQDSVPSSSTRAVVRLLCDIGSRDTLAYMACLLLSEGRVGDCDRARTSFATIAAHYGCGDETFDPILSHLEDDVAAGHTGLLAEALDGIESLSTTTADRILGYVRELRDAWWQFHDSTLSYYSDPTNPLIRRPLSFWAL